MSTDISFAPRHDGWTPECRTLLCETLAETGLVVDACGAAMMSTQAAYALRRRDPLFAAAWEASLAIARNRLADTLLARSIEGTSELYFKDGELVAEKRVLDSRLGLAILRRLDRLAEWGHANPIRPTATLNKVACRGAPAATIDFDAALAALRGDDPEAVAKALAMLDKAPKPAENIEVDEVDDPPDRLLEGEVWLRNGEWRTSFPPPADYRISDYDDDWTGAGEPYERSCTPSEVAILDAALDRRNERADADEAAHRDRWFAALAKENDDASPLA